MIKRLVCWVVGHKTPAKVIKYTEEGLLLAGDGCPRCKWIWRIDQVEWGNEYWRKR